MAFTLAEVLVTLGIIGVVAALTMPSLISHYKKQEVETKLKRFYTNINQAVKLSEVENGPVEYWNIPQSSEIGTVEEAEECYNRYFAKYLKTISTGIEHHIEYNNDGSELDYEFDYFLVKFPDGSAMSFSLSGGLNILFFTNASKVNTSRPAVDSFSFNLHKLMTVGSKNTVEPCTYLWDGTKENLISHPRYGCSAQTAGKAYCAKLIQMNGWKIPDNYPIKF